MKPGRIAPTSANKALLIPIGSGWQRWVATGLLVLISLLSLIPVSVTAAEAKEQQGIYWQISQAGRPAGFLLGTIHSEDPRVVDFSESLIEELKSCQVFAMEMVPDLPTLKKLTEYMHYAEPDRLQSLLGQERYDRTMQALSAYQVPNDWKARMKVWAVMMTLSVPAPKTGFFMDLSLSLRAAGSGLDVIGLETLEQQLQFL
ncbi:MAG TPA: TraB/GumN family protein, partial [Xanthomonadales bacterium]|nr:TraB/GumN family protein [Xanthomonadales bacterium]